ncbi:MAG: DegT/DnrJ/EryC1/StrS family aminotransferase [bacterium]
MLGVPQSRFRIYTDPSSYARVAWELATGRAQQGNAVEELEQTVARRADVRHAICMPTARTGIYLTLASIIKPGQKVLLSPITIVDVINMVLCAGGVPCFMDVEENTCNIDAAEIERNIDKNTGAVLVTHLHGLACDIERIRRTCEQTGVPLLEDAAQSFSTTVNGRWTGTFGKAGIYSFGMYKLVNAFFGGMVVTNDDALSRDIRQRLASLPYMKQGMFLKKWLFALATDISTHPLPFSLFTYWFFRYGYLHGVAAIQDMVTVDRHPVRRSAIPEELLCRMWPMQARLIAAQLDGVASGNSTRVSAGQRYHEGLSGIPQLILPPLRTDNSHIYTYYPIRCPDRHALMRYAMLRRLDLVLSHYHNTASIPVFSDFSRSCPRAEATAKELLYLPTYPRYRRDQIDKNIEVIRDFFRSQNRRGSSGT